MKLHTYVACLIVLNFLAFHGAWPSQLFPLGSSAFLSSDDMQRFSWMLWLLLHNCNQITPTSAWGILYNFSWPSKLERSIPCTFPFQKFLAKVLESSHETKEEVWKWGVLSFPTALNPKTCAFTLKPSEALTGCIPKQHCIELFLFWMPAALGVGCTAF